MTTGRSATVLALVVLALFAAGCGSAGKSSSGAITVAGTTTISSVATGTLVSCEGETGARVPPPGQGVAGNADGPGMSSEIQVTHREDGSAVVSCRHG